MLAACFLFFVTTINTVFSLTTHTHTHTHTQEDVAYSLKYTGEPNLKALTFKSITLFHSIKIIKSCVTENNGCSARGLQEHCDLTYHGPPSPGLSKCSAETFGEFGVLGMSHHSPCLALH